MGGRIKEKRFEDLVIFCLMIPDLLEKSYQIMEVDTYNSHSNQACDGSSSSDGSFNYSCAGADGRTLDQEGFGG